MHIGINLQNLKLTETKLILNVNSMLISNQFKISKCELINLFTRLSFTGKINNGNQNFISSSKPN